MSSIAGLGTLTFTPQALVPLATLQAAGAAPLLGPGFASLTPAQRSAAIGSPVATFVTRLTPSVGQRIAIVYSQAASSCKQWCNELQLNFTSERLQATLGVLWFHSGEVSGGPPGMQNTVQFPTLLPASGLIPLGDQGQYSNKATSLAAYAQLEFRITPEINSWAAHVSLKTRRPALSLTT